MADTESMKKASPENFHLYNRRLKNFAKANRHDMTKAEACLWKYALSGRKLLGYQFKRQRPILNYIADFVCLDLKLVIEVDGYTHQFVEFETATDIDAFFNINTPEDLERAEQELAS